MSEEATDKPNEGVEPVVEQEAPASKTYDETYVKQLREEAAGYRVKLKQIEDAQKSELERAQEAAEAAQRELAESKSEAARLRIAAKHGIGEDYLDFLTGADEQDLEAKALKLSELIAKPEAAPRTVVPSEGQSELPLNGSALEEALKRAVNAS